jgi:CO/xanthine dehydrogenase FAD-binding subunit
MIIEYHRPKTVTEAINLLARSEPVTVPFGGGTVLSQKRRPDFAVVDLQSLGLNQISMESQLITIGATVTLNQVEESQVIPEGIHDSLRRSLAYECSINLRRAGTAAGTLVSCDGRSTFSTALLALDARLVWAPGEEIQALGDFLPLRKPFGQERFMLSIRITGNAKLYIDMIARSPLDRPIVCAAVARWPSGRTRVAVCGYGKAPVLAMDGPEPGGAAIAAREAYRFSDDEWASAAYRMDAAAMLVQRILAEDTSTGFSSTAADTDNE